MKLLIASQGSTLNSPLASSIERASWYMIVDTRRHEITALRASRQPPQSVLRGAAAYGIRVLILGGNVSASQTAKGYDMTMVSFAGAMTVGEALDCWKEQCLKASRPAATSHEEPARIRSSPPGSPTRPRGRHAHHTTATMAAHRRRRYHLQQYSGRGH